MKQGDTLTIKHGPLNDFKITTGTLKNVFTRNYHSSPLRSSYIHLVQGTNDIFIRVEDIIELKTIHYEYTPKPSTSKIGVPRYVRAN